MNEKLAKAIGVAFITFVLLGLALFIGYATQSYSDQQVDMALVVVTRTAEARPLDPDLEAFMSYVDYLTFVDGDCGNDWLTHMSNDMVRAAAVNWALRHELCDNPEMYMMPGWSKQ